MKHKEEMPYKIALDEKNRKRLRSTLAGLIHPLDKSQLGQQKRHRRAVITSVLISAEVIFSRIVGYLNSGRVEVTIVVALETELGPIPVALVNEKKGCVLRPTTKASLVEASESGIRKMDIIISDASAFLRNLPWPGTGGLVSDFINTVRQHVENLLIDYDQVFFIFDRNNSDSIKGEERLVRSKGVTRTYVLSPGVEMPAQKIVTSVTRNKVQLIDLIVASLTDDPILSKSCLILTGSQETPYKIQDGKVELCPELRTLHAEADVVIINQLIWAVRDENPATNVLVKCDDTDVFVLLVHYYSKLNLTCCLMMQGPVKGRKLIDIGLTVVRIR